MGQLMAVCLFVEIEWNQEEPDGSTCEVCEEVAWLEMHRLIFHCAKMRLPQRVVICGSCYQEKLREIMASDDEGGELDE